MKKLLKSQIKFWPGIIPAVILLYFPLKHYQNELEIPYLNIIISFLYIIMVFFVVFLTSTKNKFIREHAQKLLYIYSYTFIAVFIFLIISLFSEYPYKSTMQSIFAVTSMSLTFISFYFVQYFFLYNHKWRRFFEISSIIFLLSIFVGQLIFDDWKIPNNIRLSGGVNPNVMGYLALYFLFQSHLNSFIDNKWVIYQKLLWLLSFIAIFLTFSRTTLLTLVCAYALYAFQVIISKIFKKQKIKIRSILNLLMQVILSVLGLFIVYKLISQTKIYTEIQLRFSNIDNVSSRSDTWTFIMNSFKDHPLVGWKGWWGTKEFLELTESFADSPHNLYIRLLSDVGLIGMFAILLLPIIIFLILVFKYKEINIKFNNNIAKYLVAILVSIFFVEQIFEDRFLSGFFTNTTDVTLWFLSLILIVAFTTNEQIEKTKRIDY